MLDKVLTLAEAARLWHMESSSLRHAIRDGRLPATKSDGTWLVIYEDMVRVYGEEPKEGRDA